MFPGRTWLAEKEKLNRAGSIGLRQTKCKVHEKELEKAHTK